MTFANVCVIIADIAIPRNDDNAKTTLAETVNSLKDIACELKVSPSTVSRALSGSGGVSEKMRRRILSIAQRHGYSPDSAASSLRTGKCRGLTMITPRERSGIATMRDEALFAKARERFGSVRVATLNNDESLESAVSKAAAEKPAAIAVCNASSALPSGIATHLASKGIALLGVDCGEQPGMDQISIDRSAGAFQMARMLVLTGVRNPVFMTSGATIDNPDGRLAGIIKGLESLGQTLRPEQILRFETAGNPAKNGFECAERILRTAYADAIFAYSDIYAIGVMRALLKNGVAIPEGVKLIGFDNMPFSEFLPISLTTVAQPVHELVDAALEMLAARLATMDAPPQRRVLKTCLVLRESAPVHEHSLKR